MIMGVAFLTIGVLALFQQLGYLPKDLDLFWSIIFIALGLSFFFGKKGHGHGCCGWGEKGKKK